MSTYSSASNVQLRIPYRSIGSGTTPSTTTVESWLVFAEAKLHGVLAAGEISTPIVTSDGIEIMSGWVEDYAEGRTRKAYASADGDGGNPDGQDLLDNFEAVLKDILAKPTLYEAMLVGVSSSGSQARRLRCYQVDNTDGKSVAAGDFDPQFEKSRGGDQF